jgi:MFS family permease
MSTRPATPLAAFRSRDFRLLWFGNLFSLTGTEMGRTAISWQLYQLTGDPLALGLIGAARLIPLVFLALGAGVLADALDRRKLMFGAQVAMLFCALTMAWLNSTDQITTWAIYLVTALAAAAHTLGMPARQAIIPTLVPREHLAGALTLNITAWQLATVLGPSLGGVIIAAYGVGTVFWVESASFIFILSALLMMRTPPVRSEKRNISLAAAVEGLVFVRRHKLIWSTMLLDFLATFFSAATTLLPIYASQILQVGPQGLGLLAAAPSAGAVTASIATSIIGPGKRQGRLLIGAVMVYGLSTAIFGISTSFWLSMLMLALNGASDTVSMIVRGAIRNLETPDELRGRMVSVNMLFFAGGPQLGEIEAGAAARLLGTPISVLVGGLACMFASGAVAAATPELRRYTDGSKPVETVAETKPATQGAD